MVWVLLGLAIASEVAGTIALRYSDGFTRPLPVLVVAVGYGLAFYLLSLTLRELSLSITYAVWSGVGTAAVAAIGMAALGESVNAVKLMSIGLIIVGVVGLNLAEQ